MRDNRRILEEFQRFKETDDVQIMVNHSTQQSKMMSQALTTLYEDSLDMDRRSSVDKKQTYLGEMIPYNNPSI